MQPAFLVSTLSFSFPQFYVYFLGGRGYIPSVHGDLRLLFVIYHHHITLLALMYDNCDNLKTLQYVPIIALPFTSLHFYHLQGNVLDVLIICMIVCGNITFISIIFRAMFSMV